MPSVDDLLTRAHVVSVPMRVRFRGVTVREAMLFDGPAGWGEWSPFVEYEDVEAATWLQAAIESAWAGWPEPVRDSVPVNATVPAVAAAAVPDVLSRFGGCTTVKIKVAEPGQTLDEDVARVAAVRAVLPDALLRIDANGAWSVAEAYEALARLEPYLLHYAEQPVAAVSDLVALRERLDAGGIDVTLAADESIRKASDPLAVARTGAVGVAVVKVQPLGGVRQVLQIAEQLSTLGVRIVISSALDTGVGIAAGVAAAAALPDEPLASGLGTATFFTDDVCVPPLVPIGGRLTVLRQAPTPDVERFAAGRERTDWWHERLARCAALVSRR